MQLHMLLHKRLANQQCGIAPSFVEYNSISLFDHSSYVSCTWFWDALHDGSRSWPAQIICKVTADSWHLIPNDASPLPQNSRFLKFFQIQKEKTRKERGKHKKEFSSKIILPTLCFLNQLYRQFSCNYFYLIKKFVNNFLLLTFIFSVRLHLHRLPSKNLFLLSSINYHINTI